MHRRAQAQSRRGNLRVPAAWRSLVFPNIVSWVPGHRREMWTIPAMRRGLISSIQLAAKGAAAH
jgi:hypothetical protein